MRGTQEPLSGVTNQLTDPPVIEATDKYLLIRTYRSPTLLLVHYQSTNNSTVVLLLLNLSLFLLYKLESIYILVDSIDRGLSKRVGGILIAIIIIESNGKGITYIVVIVTASHMVVIVIAGVDVT